MGNDSVKRLKTAKDIDALLERLFWLNRSLSGEGNRKTLRIIAEYLPIEVKKYPCGSGLFDWTVPDEWVIRDAWIRDSEGRDVVCFSDNPLHVVSYSGPVNATLTFDELRGHLHTLQNVPNAIPYRTSYYQKDWGFCVTQSQYQNLLETPGEFHVFIDSEFKPDGNMVTGELVIPGESSEEYLVSTYICHPAMANDNLSGIVAAMILARDCLDHGPSRVGWRFAFVPETIGAIAYLADHETDLASVKGGFVLSCCGGKGPLGYKSSFQGNSSIDRAVELAFRDFGIEPLRYPFLPTGSDERQFSSPGFRIPMTTVCKDKYHEYREYHTSLDNLEFVTGEQILAAVTIYRAAFLILEQNKFYKSLFQKGEPQLGRRGLYPRTGGGNNQPADMQQGERSQYTSVEALSWALFLADGKTDLLTMSEKSGVRFVELLKIFEKLQRENVVQLNLPSSNPRKS